MILVDTSVMIDFLRGTQNTPVALFDEILERKIPYGINDFIFQELLQGSADKKEFDNLKGYLETIPFYYLLHGRESYERAAFLNFKCRRSGITIKSTIDLVIAETAIENGLYLLHNDGDFDNIAKVDRELKIHSKG
jgi:predicted nucleic acid-binding protein